MQDSDPVADSTPAPLSRAADIPQELFEHIVWHTTRWKFFVLPDYNRTRDICTLSLVSRYFAVLCRPHLFLALQFCNAKQMRGFLTLMEASPTPSLPHISTFVRQIRIEPVGSDDYWIHQIATALLPKLKRYCDQTPELTLSLKGHGSLATPRTMMPILTRSGVRWLYLRDMTFHRGEELLRILATFPALYHCSLASVALETLLDPVAIRRNLPNTSLQSIAFHDCTPAIRTCLIRWLMSSPSRDDIPPWDTEDAEAIAELTRDLDITGAHRDDTSIYLSRHSVSIEIHPETFGRLASDVRHVHRTGFKMENDDKKSLKHIAEAASTLGRTLEHLREINFNFTDLSDPKGFIMALHATLQQAVGSTRLVYRRFSTYFDPQLILSKRYYRFLGAESGWCRSTGRGGETLACIPAMAA